VDKDNMGHTVINGVGIEQVYCTKELYNLLESHMIMEVNKAIEISKKYGNQTSNVHVYLKNCSLKNFPLSLYKNLVKKLESTFDDTLNLCYIYDISRLAATTWAFLRFFLDPVTRNKILLVNTGKMITR
jgi:hypothetical protein